MKSTAKNKNITYGKISFHDDDFDSKNIKERITTYVDLDVLDKIKSLAKKNKIGYQALLNQMLRNSIENNNFPQQELEEIKKILLKINKKIAS